MSLVLLISRADPASVNMGRALREQRDWAPAGEFRGCPAPSRHGALGRFPAGKRPPLPVQENDGKLLVEIEDMHIHAEDVDHHLADAGFNVDGIVFCSKHRAASGNPSLTVHPIGNFRDAEFGGRPGHLCPTMPAFMARCLNAIHDRARNLQHAVTYEATHHGPAVNVPACFVEIGTTEESWLNETLGNLLAEAILEAADGPLLEEKDSVNLIAVGGSHYAPRATDLTRKRRAGVGHILPGYHVDAGVDPAMVLEAVRRTPGAKGYYLDERGCKKEHLEPVLHAFTGLEFGRYTEEDVAAR